MSATAASVAPLPDPADSFHAAFAADLAPRTCAECFFADQAARAAAALQQLNADDASSLTAQYRLSTFLSRALRELRLLQSDRRNREQRPQPPAPPSHEPRTSERATDSRTDAGSVSADPDPRTTQPAPPRPIAAPEAARAAAIPATISTPPERKPTLPNTNPRSTPAFASILNDAPTAAATALLLQRRRRRT